MVRGTSAEASRMSSPAPSIEDQIRALAPQVDAHPVEVAKACIAAVTQQPFLVPAYKLLAKALHKLQNAAGLDQAGAMARDNGLALVRNGRLAEAASFFEEVASAFPAVCAP